MDEREVLKKVYLELKALTKKERKFLRIMLSEPDTWLTRNDLAQRLGIPYLYPHDRHILQHLEALYFVDVHKERLLDEYIRRGNERPKDWHGKRIQLQSQYYSYRINPAFVPIFEKLLFKRPAPRPARPASQGQRQAVVYGSWRARLKDMLGLE